MQHSKNSAHRSDIRQSRATASCFCKARSMVPCCRGAEHAASRRRRIRIIVIATVEGVVVAVSIEPRGCGRARKHGRGREYQKSKFPCHGSRFLCNDIGRHNRSECRVFQRAHPPNAGLRFDVRANLARISERVIRRVADVRVGAFSTEPAAPACHSMSALT